MHVGLTAVPRSGGGFTLPPTSILQTSRVDQVYIVVRQVTAAMLTRTACDQASGSATFAHFNNHVVGCHVMGGADCMPAEINFVDHEPHDLPGHGRDRPDQDHRGHRHLCRRARRAADVEVTWPPWREACARILTCGPPRARRLPRVRAGRARAGLRVGLRRGGVRRRARQRGHDQPDGALLQPGGHRVRRGHASVRERRARAAPRELVAHASGVRGARAAGRRGGGHRAGALLQSVWRAGAGGDDLDPPARAGRRVLRPVRRAGPLGSEPALRERPELSPGGRRRAALAHHRGRGDVALLHGGRRAPPRARRARRDRQPGSIVGVTSGRPRASTRSRSSTRSTRGASESTSPARTPASASGRWSKPCASACGSALPIRRSRGWARSRSTARCRPASAPTWRHHGPSRTRTRCRTSCAPGCARGRCSGAARARAARVRRPDPLEPPADAMRVRPGRTVRRLPGRNGRDPGRDHDPEHPPPLERHVRREPGRQLLDVRRRRGVRGRRLRDRRHPRCDAGSDDAGREQHPLRRWEVASPSRVVFTSPPG